MVVADGGNVGTEQAAVAGERDATAAAKKALAKA
jgi:hypothetical protein